eukprot:1156706-Pelagomonas_calceolata.AAC.5
MQQLISSLPWKQAPSEGSCSAKAASSADVKDTAAVLLTPRLVRGASEGRGWAGSGSICI